MGEIASLPDFRAAREQRQRDLLARGHEEHREAHRKVDAALMATGSGLETFGHIHEVIRVARWDPATMRAMDDLCQRLFGAAYRVVYLAYAAILHNAKSGDWEDDGNPD